MAASLTVRAAELADAPSIQRIYEKVVSETAISFEEQPPDAHEIGRRMTSRPRLPWLVAVREHSVLGYAYSSAHRPRAAYRWSVDCSVYVDEPERGNGIGRALYAELLAQLRDLNYVSAYAGIALPNAASVRLHEAMGFVPVGVFRHVGYKFGAWHDVGWWQRRIADPPPSPGEPLEWGNGTARAGQ